MKTGQKILLMSLISSLWINKLIASDNFTSENIDISENDNSATSNDNKSKTRGENRFRNQTLKQNLTRAEQLEGYIDIDSQPLIKIRDNENNSDNESISSSDENSSIDQSSQDVNMQTPAEQLVIQDEYYSNWLKDKASYAGDITILKNFVAKGNMTDLCGMFPDAENRKVDLNDSEDVNDGLECKEIDPNNDLEDNDNANLVTGVRTYIESGIKNGVIGDGFWILKDYSKAPDSIIQEDIIPEPNISKEPINSSNPPKLIKLKPTVLKAAQDNNIMEISNDIVDNSEDTPLRGPIGTGIIYPPVIEGQIVNEEINSAQQNDILKNNVLRNNDNNNSNTVIMSDVVYYTGAHLVIQNEKYLMNNVIVDGNVFSAPGNKDLTLIDVKISDKNIKLKGPDKQVNIDGNDCNNINIDMTDLTGKSELNFLTKNELNSYKQQINTRLKSTSKLKSSVSKLKNTPLEYSPQERTILKAEQSIKEQLEEYNKDANEEANINEAKFSLNLDNPDTRFRVKEGIFLNVDFSLKGGDKISTYQVFRNVNGNPDYPFYIKNEGTIVRSNNEEFMIFHLKGSDDKDSHTDIVVAKITNEEIRNKLQKLADENNNKANINELENIYNPTNDNNNPSGDNNNQSGDNNNPPDNNNSNISGDTTNDSNSDSNNDSNRINNESNDGNNSTTDQDSENSGNENNSEKSGNDKSGNNESEENNTDSYSNQLSDIDLIASLTDDGISKLFDNKFNKKKKFSLKGFYFSNNPNNSGGGIGTLDFFTCNKKKASIQLSIFGGITKSNLNINNTNYSGMSYIVGPKVSLLNELFSLDLLGGYKHYNSNKKTSTDKASSNTLLVAAKPGINIRIGEKFIIHPNIILSGQITKGKNDTNSISYNKIDLKPALDFFARFNNNLYMSVGLGFNMKPYISSKQNIDNKILKSSGELSFGVQKLLLKSLELGAKFNIGKVFENDSNKNSPLSFGVSVYFSKLF